MKLRVITLCLLVIGMVIFAYSLSLPYYKNNKTPYEVVSDDSTNYKDEYYRYEETYRTNKIDLMDFGAGLCVVALSFLTFLLVTKTKHFSDFKYINTPGIPGIFLGANTMWLLTIPGTYWYYTFRAGRGDYPPFADSIGIPIYTQVPVCFLLLIPLNIFILFCIVTTNLPAPLLIKANRYNAGRIVLEVLFGFLMLINLICLSGEILDGDHFLIAVSMYFIYVILSLRAGIVHRYNTNDSLAIEETSTL
jgi:hypothetical protein